MSIFKGSGVAVITPFDKETVDYETLSEIVEFQIANKTDAIIVCGTTGEASTMTEEEKIKTIKTVIEAANKRVPVIAGTGGNNTKEVIRFTNVVEELGVDGLLIVTPYYNKCTQSGLYEHYSNIAENTITPIIMYNVPGRTGVNIEPETAAKIYEDNESVVAIKEASGNFDKLATLKSLCDIDIYSGNDTQIVPAMSLGAIGVISVLANILPKETHQIAESYLRGETNIARELQLKYNKLISLLFNEVNPIPIKAAMNMIGFKAGIPRLPLTELEDKNKELLIAELKCLKIL